MTTITCQSCRNVFPEIEPGFAMFNQAHGCAAEVKNRELIGYYGCTTIDLERWFFLDRPVWVIDGTICDECILRLMSDDSIKLIERGVC